jgi:diguanylate cyclase (GGDEF)-like protein/PAS domain S-box-containing protein
MIQLADLTGRLKKRFYDATVSHKIVLIVMVVLGCTMMLAAVINISLSMNNNLQHAHENLQEVANSLSLNLQGPLVFKDKNGAREVLHGLQGNPEILKAEVRNNDRVILASYTANYSKLNHHQFLNLMGFPHAINVTNSIKLNSDVIGTISLQASLDSLWDLLLKQLIQSIAVATLLLYLAFFVSRRIAEVFVEPIKKIAKTAIDIRSGNDYSRHVINTSKDEVGQLADEFNKMLDVISQREQALKDSEFLWKFAIEGAGDGVWDINIQTGEARYSSRWKEMLGYTDSDLLPTINDWTSRIHVDDKLIVEANLKAYLEGKTNIYTVEYRKRCKDEGYKWVLSRGVLVNRSQDGKPIRMIGTISDITDRKNAESELKVAAIAFESQEGIFITDAYGAIVRANRAFLEITRYKLTEIIGQNPRIFSSGKQSKVFYASMWESIKNKGFWDGEIWNRRKSGEIYPGQMTVTAVKDTAGIVTHYVATLYDITKSKAAAESIKTLAFYDPLTKLPNRRLLVDRLQQSVIASTRDGHCGALLFLDLDHFKKLNDTLGHDIGDLLLKQVAKRLTHTVRAGDTVARMGGDEFVIILEDLCQEPLAAGAEAEVVANKILASLNQAYQLGRYEYFNTASIGITIINDHLVATDELLKHADIAMYEAKKLGRNTFHFFDPWMQEAINTRSEMERDLRNAITLQQFRLYYQIQVNHKGHSLGAEALIRWLHPLHGIVSPNHFIPLAEDAGLILPIGLWVLETACVQLKAWEQDPLMRDLTISINVSSKQFKQADFVMQVKAAVQRNAINPILLKLELTESMLIENIDYVITTMRTLKEIGVRFALDDFGTGYSSLQYLRILPLHQLKIDRSFVRDIAIDLNSSKLVNTIILMARSLDLEVIAEGVETEQQQQLLADYGCTNYQGYLFGRPMPINEFELLIKKNDCIDGLLCG